MQLRLLLQLLLGAHASAHALPDGYALPHSLHRRMPPPKLPPPNSHGPTHPGVGNAANRAFDPATGSPAEIVDPVTGQLIGDVNPVTGSSREGFNPMTGQLDDNQPGRTETRPLGSPPLPQYIPRNPFSGLPRYELRIPVPNQAGARPGEAPGPRPGSPPSDNRINPPRVYNHGKYLSRESISRVKIRGDRDALAARLEADQPVIRLEEFAFEDILVRPDVEVYWSSFLMDRAILGPVSLGNWRRITVRTIEDDPLKVLDLAIYPDHQLVVFIKHPMDQSLQRKRYQQQISELVYHSLQRINPGGGFQPNKFLFPDPTRYSEIGTAVWNSMERYQPGNYPLLFPMESEARFLEIVGTGSTAPVSYMIMRHPDDFAGPVKEAVVVGGPQHQNSAVVLLRLGPISNDGE